MTYLVRCNDEANVISPDNEPISCIHCLWGEAGNRAVIQESGAPWRAFSPPINPLVLSWVGHWWIDFCLFTRIEWQPEPASLISGDTGAHKPAVLFLLFWGMVAPHQGTNIPHKKPTVPRSSAQYLLPLYPFTHKHPLWPKTQNLYFNKELYPFHLTTVTMTIEGCWWTGNSGRGCGPIWHRSEFRESQY